MNLVSEVYKLTGSFPREEIYGLTSQLRQTAVSIPSNIAEGQARVSHREFCHFLNNARVSLAEVEAQLSVAQGLGFLERTSAKHVLAKIADLGKVVNGLLASVKTR